jgi:hypothetical protein
MLMARSMRLVGLAAVLLLMPILSIGRADGRRFDAVTLAADLQADGVTVVAAGLTNPRGFAWDESGTLYVSVAGAGGIDSAPLASPEATPAAPQGDEGTPVIEGVAASFTAANDAGVVRIVDGCPVAVATGLPSSAIPPLGWVFGTTGLAVLDGQIYVLVDGGGEAGLHPDEPNGLYRIGLDGSVTLVADLSAWFRANPTEHLWGEITPDGEPWSLVADERSGLLWVTEANHEQLLTITPDGAITRVADLSPLGNVVPTGLALAPNGGVYVGFLTAVPHPDGTSKVIQIAPDGTMTDVWTGLTAVTQLAVGPEGQLYASEMSTGNLDVEPFLRPHSGRIVRQTGPDSHEVVVDRLDYPIHLAIGPDGGLYVATPAIGANAGEGQILRFETSAMSVHLLRGTPAAPVCA